MDEQQGQTTATTVPATPKIACQHPEAAGKRWGDAISEDRQQELAAIQEAWDAPGADHGNLKGPFDGWPLTGADVTWLVKKVDEDDGPHLEGADLFAEHLEGATLRGAHLEGANLSAAHLETLYVNTSRGSPTSQPRQYDAAPLVAITQMLPTASETSPGDPHRPSLPRSTPA